MRMTLKRLTAWMLTLMMIFSCVSASAVDGNVVDYSDSTSAYDVMPQDDSASESITVTFVINNSDYTNDPGSQTTHITAKAPIEGGGLTYTKWAGRYKVTGTGAVCSYSIPAGTSLSDRGYALPALSVENIGNTNTYSYSSLKTWVTADGMVCSADTDFEADTTLYLQLFESGSDIYSLDFVCSTDNHSIKSVGNFLLGQSVSQAHIDAATEAANAFESQWCSYGPASNQRLQKWQLKKTATGEMVDLSAGMAITEEYVNSQYGTAVKVYAVWEENTSTPVTATFQYDVTVDGTTTTQTADTRTLNAGDALGELPDMTAHTPEGSTFIGWQYTAADGSLQYATAETVITADTVFTAVFGTQVTATFQHATSYDEETSEPIYETIETRTLNAGDALGELPDMTAYNTPYETFESWQYTDADGNEQTATTETVITEDTVYTAVFVEPEYGYVTIYDMLPDGNVRDDAMPNIPIPVGLTIAEGFAASEEFKGFALGDDALPSKCVWHTVDGERDDLTEVVTAETDISLYTYTYQIVLTLKLNTVSPAAFTSRTRASVNPSTADDGTITMTITAREGEQLTENDFIVNGTDLTQYAWTDENGNAVDIQSLMKDGVTRSITATSDGTPAVTDLTVQLTLTLNGETFTKTITEEEGYTFAADDFVVNGIDLTDYVWTDGNGATGTLETLLGATLTHNSVLTSDGTLNAQLESNQRTVRYYVFVNGERVLVTSRTEKTYLINGRYYIPASTLSAVYGKYGYSEFSASKFPHAVDGERTVWKADAAESNGVYFSPTLTSERGTQTVDIYYVPADNMAKESATYASLISSNNHYTVTVEDLSGMVYGAGELPEVTYTLVGNTATVKVKAKEGVEWACEGQYPDVIDSTIKTVKNDDGTITFTITDIREPYVISTGVPANSVVVQYDRNLSQTPSDLEYGVPMINGAETHTDIVLVADADEYKALSLNPSSYFYESGKYQGEEVFTGWAVSVGGTSTDTVVRAGDTLDLAQYGGQVVTLTAQWETHMGGTIGGPRQSSMVNFFVSFNAISEGSSSWIGQTKTSNFTPSVYTMDCGVIGQDVIDYLMNHVHEIEGEAGQFAVIGDTSGGNLNKAHWDIVNQLTAGYTLTGSNGKDYNFTGTFPTDEHVLRTIRQMMADNPAMSIRINGREIEASELTTTNFTIRWYVFKLASTDTDTFKDDGWHIDGILVAKQGEMIVTKTFAGDPQAIAAIKSNFTIDVALDENQENAVHTGKTLHIKNSDAYDGNNTYTWKVPVDQYFDYTVTENNYVYNVDLATYKAQYRVRHSNVSSQNTGWTHYGSGSDITVTGRGYNDADDGRLQVDFLNTYTAPGTVIVQKIDAVTGNLMPNVSFKIGGMWGADNQTKLQLYHVSEGYYSAEPSSGTLTDTITTDSSGQAYLWIGGGSYWLEEIVPDGYDDPGRISIELKGDADSSYKVVAITSAVSENTEKAFVDISGDGDLTLIVKNYSRTIDLKVTKDWVNNENKPVTIQLYRGGKPMGADYTVTLDGSENWTHTFEDLPLYADGGLARYTIREEKIGDFMYSDEFTTGYLYYDVDYSSMKYLDARGNVTTDMTQVKTIALEASNDRNHGSLSIGKVDEKNVALGGAVFYLYEASTGSTVPRVIEDDDGHNVLTEYVKVGEATSAANGGVNFGTVNAGRYYLIEHSAPEGYIGSDLVYLVQFDGTNVTMQYYAANEDGTGGWTTTAKRVTNTSVTVDIPVTKKWVDNDNEFGRRPNSINVTLTGTDSDGKVVSTQTVTLTADNSDNNFREGETAKQSDTWTHTFEDLPQYVSGKAVTYTVSESVIAGYTPVYDQTKHTITNTLAQNLSFTVSKLVEGNFADPNKAFNFTAVAYNAAGEKVARQTFTLAHGGSKIIENLPYGAYIVVTEKPDGYTAQYMLGPERTVGASYTSGALLDSNQGVTFINTKNVTVDTGVDLDGLPYALLLLGVVGIAVVWLLLYLGRRKED